MLRRLGHVDKDGIVLTKGRAACEFDAADELLTTELMFNGVFTSLDKHQLVALASCLIPLGEKTQAGFFSWLSEAQLHYQKNARGEKRLKGVKVRLCDWPYRAILRDRRVLEYSPSYFQLGPVERRLYEVARSTCTAGAVQVGLDDLRLQLGYQNSLKHFRHVMKGISEENAIPDYHIVMGDGLAAEMSTTKRRTTTATTVTITPKPSLSAA